MFVEILSEEDKYSKSNKLVFWDEIMYYMYSFDRYTKLRFSWVNRHLNQKINDVQHKSAEMVINKHLQCEGMFVL